MNIFNNIQNKIQSWETAAKNVKQWQHEGETVVFTNGCFDILHYGHIYYLSQARDLGDKLVVGLNAGASVSQLKGKHRPINDEATRQTLLAAFSFVDVVIMFEQKTPYELISLLKPNKLVKGGDWQVSQIVGSDVVLAHGGEVLSLPFVEGYSTTNIEQKIIRDYLDNTNG